MIRFMPPLGPQDPPVSAGAFAFACLFGMVFWSGVFALVYFLT